MSQESFNTQELFTITPDDFRANYRSLSPVELEGLGESPLSAVESLPEEAAKTVDGFLQNTFEYWSSGSSANAKISAEARLPSSQNWSGLETDIDTSKFGEYTLNPETQSLDFEKAKPFIPDLSSMVGKKLSEVADYIVKTYGNKYYLPGLEYEQWIHNHPDLDSLPSGSNFDSLKGELKNNYVFFFGSTLRYSNGRWGVPYVTWNGSGWDRGAGWLGDGWNSDCRVVLLER